MLIDNAQLLLGADYRRFRGPGVSISHGLVPEAMSDGFDFSGLIGVFGPETTTRQLRARWERAEGRATLAEVLRMARKGERWQDLLAEFPFAEETFDGQDLTLGQRDLRGAPLDGLDLRGADLHDAFLDDVTLKGADLSGANLQRAHINGTDLAAADLAGADLAEADGRADFRGARLDRARLTRGFLRGSDLRDVSFVGADLTDANLWDSRMSGADLTGAITVNTKFSEPREESGRSSRRPSTVEERAARWLTPEGSAALAEALRLVREGGPWQDALSGLAYVEETAREDASISRRDLRGAPLDGLDLGGADLSAAFVHDASARGADFRGASFRGSVANDADFSGADLRDADFSLAKGRISFREARLDRARFFGATLQASDFQDATLTATDFSEASLFYCNISDEALAAAAAEPGYRFGANIW